MSRSARIAFLDEDLDPALPDRAHRGAGIGYEKHAFLEAPFLRDRGVRPTNDPLTGAPYHPRALAAALRRPRPRPSIQAVVLHDGEGSFRNPEEAVTARAVIAGARARVWVMPRPPPLAPVDPLLRGAQPLTAPGALVAAFRLAAEVPIAAVLARLAQPDRDRLYLVADPDEAWCQGLADPAGAALLAAGFGPRTPEFDAFHAWVRSARWVLTSHAAWPEWVPWCLYTTAVARALPGLVDAPDLLWLTAPAEGVGPVQSEADHPSSFAFVDLAAHAHAEVVHLAHTPVVRLGALRGIEALRELDLPCSPYFDRGELGSLGQLESLDLRGVPLRDLAFLAPLTGLRSLRLDLVPRDRWESLRALPQLRHLDLWDVEDLDLAVLASGFRGRALTLRRPGAPLRMASLSGAPALEALHVDAGECEDFQRLSELPLLRALMLAGPVPEWPRGLDSLVGLRLVASVSLCELPRLLHLKRLGLDSLESLEGLADLSHLSPLEHLAIRSGSDDLGSLDPIATHSSLRSLLLADLDRPDLEPLGRLPHLEELGLDGCGVDLVQVARWPRLRRLEIRDDGVDLAPLGGHAELREIVLHAPTPAQHASVLLLLPALARVTYAPGALDLELAAALRARGVLVHTHPARWRLSVDADLGV